MGVLDLGGVELGNDEHSQAPGDLAHTKAIINSCADPELQATLHLSKPAAPKLLQNSASKIQRIQNKTRTQLPNKLVSKNHPN